MQVIIWRNWAQHEDQKINSGWGEGPQNNEPVQIAEEMRRSVQLPFEFAGFESQSLVPGHTAELSSDRLILIVPTSLCSSEPAKLIAKHVNQMLLQQGVADAMRCVALPHSEGCGSSEASLASRVLVGHLLHPSVQLGILIEHGCEKTHNDFYQHTLGQVLPPSCNLTAIFGWFSLQLDGGLDKVVPLLACSVVTLAHRSLWLCNSG